MSNIITADQADDVTDLVLPAREPDESNFRYLERLMDALPAPDEDAGDALIGKLLGAATLTEQNDAWDATSTRDLIGRRFVFHTLTCRPSDQPDGLQFFLVCRVTDSETGEQDTITTGSQNVVAQLVRAYYGGMLPAEARIEGPKRKTPDGKTPLHLIWTGKVLR